MMYHLSGLAGLDGVTGLICACWIG